MSGEARSVESKLRNRKSISEMLERRQLLAPLPVGYADLAFRITGFVADPVRNLAYLVGDDAKVHVVDMDAGRETKQILLPFHPGTAGITPDGSHLIVAAQEEQKVQIVSLTSQAAVRTLNVGYDLISIAGGVGGKFYGAYEGTDQHPYISGVVQYDLTTGASVDIAPTESPGYLRANSSGTHLYFNNDSFYSADNQSSLDEYDISIPTNVRRIRRYIEDASSVADFFPDRSAGRLYRVGSNGEADVVSYYDVNTGTSHSLWSGDGDDFYYSGGINSLTKLAGANTIYLGRGYFDGQSTIDSINVSTGALLDTYDVPGQMYEKSMAITPNGRVAFTSARDTYGYPDEWEWSFGIVGVEHITMMDSEPVLMGSFYEDVDRDSARDPNEKWFESADDSWEPRLRVYLDLNNNGQWDEDRYGEADEPAIEWYGDGSPYRFPVDAPGTYVVRFQVDSQGDLGFPIFAGPRSAHTVTLVTGQQVSNLDFGVMAGFDVSGSVFVDYDGDGKKDASDHAIEGVVYLDSNNNGKFDAGEPDAVAYGEDPSGWSDGGYNLEAPSGAGTLRFKNDRGYTLSTPAGVAIAGTRGGDYTASFGIQPMLDLHGLVYDDDNGNGKRDVGEQARAGVRVWLDANRNSKYDKGERNGVSDSAGHYVVRNYRIQNTLNVMLRTSTTKWIPTTSAARTVRFEDWQESIALDFGVYQPSTISVMAFRDNDRNRKWSRGDRKVAGIMVYIDRDRDGKQDKNEMSLITDGSGYVTFTGLKPGTYLVRVRVPSSFRWTTPTSFNVSPLKQGSTVSFQSGMRAR